MTRPRAAVPPHYSAFRIGIVAFLAALLLAAGAWVYNDPQAWEYVHYLVQP